MCEIGRCIIGKDDYLKDTKGVWEKNGFHLDENFHLNHLRVKKFIMIKI
jgi:hypothetical protein